jgi:hypothetical protein
VTWLDHGRDAGLDRLIAAAAPPAGVDLQPDLPVSSPSLSGARTACSSGLKDAAA